MLSAVHLVNDPQPVEREVGIHSIEDLGLLTEYLSVAARADNFGVRTQFFLHPGDDALDQADVSEDDAGLKGGGGISADGRTRASELDPVESGGPAEQGLGGDAEPRGDSAAHVVAFAVDGIEDCSCAKVDDDQ